MNRPQLPVLIAGYPVAKYPKALAFVDGTILGFLFAVLLFASLNLSQRAFIAPRTFRPSSLAAGWVGGMRRTTTLSLLFCCRLSLHIADLYHRRRALLRPISRKHPMSLFHFLRPSLLAQIRQATFEIGREIRRDNCDVSYLVGGPGWRMGEGVHGRLSQSYKRMGSPRK